MIEYIYCLEWIQYNPKNFKATDHETEDRLEVTEKLSGDYKVFIIEIKEYIGAPEKGDTYTFTIKYDICHQQHSHYWRTCFCVFRL